MADLAECVPLPVSDLAGITDYAVRQDIDLLVVGPEVPLTEGIADLAEEKGIAVFGPSKAAARLEGSKSFAKMLMKNTVYRLRTMKALRTVRPQKRT